MVIGAGCGCVFGYLFVKNIAIPRYQYDKRVERAEAMFQTLCKRSGVFIRRTVRDVEEIRLINVRDPEARSDRQFTLWDPYGDEPGAEAYIATFLERPADCADGEVGSMSARRFRAVYAELPGGTMKRFSYTSGGRFSVHPVTGPTPRFGVRFKDISTREHRNYWIAGSSLQVVDLLNDEVIAERIGYLWDPGQGDRYGGRSPWGMAARRACPGFHPLPGMDGFTPPRVVQRGQAFRFVSQVVILKQ